MSVTRARRTREALRAAMDAVDIPDQPVVIRTDGPATVTVQATDGPTTPFTDDEVDALVASLGDDALFAVGLLVKSGSPHAARVVDTMAEQLLAGVR